VVSFFESKKVEWGCGLWLQWCYRRGWFPLVKFTKGVGGLKFRLESKKVERGWSFVLVVGGFHL